jgi:hypothetical protein
MGSNERSEELLRRYWGAAYERKTVEGVSWFQLAPRFGLAVSAYPSL